MQWIKMYTGMIDGFSFKMVKKSKGKISRDKLTAVWVELLLLAGKCNNCGNFWNEAYSEHMDVDSIATHLDRKPDEIKQCLDFFVRERMIDFDGEKYCVTNWQKYQSEDKLEQIRKHTRERQKKYRERKSEVEIQNSEIAERDNNVMSNVTVTLQKRDANVSSDVTNTLQRSNSTSTLNSKSDKSESSSYRLSDKEYIYIKDLFNQKCGGFAPEVVILSDDDKRGMDACKDMVEQAGGWEEVFDMAVASDFLNGKSGERYNVMDGKWFNLGFLLRPEKMIKLINGDYGNPEKETNHDHDKWLGQDYTGSDLPF